MGLEDGNGTVTIKPHTDGEHMSDEVLVERPGAVQVITIKRPEARNALNRAVAVGVRDAVDELDAAADPGLIPLSVHEIQRLLAAALNHPRPPGHAARWLEFRRRQQARSRWFNQRTRLARTYALVS